MHFPEFPHIPNTIEELKREIESLCQTQNEALKTATFVGMTPEVARRYDERRQRINRLSEQLRLLNSKEVSPVVGDAVPEPGV